MAAPAFRALDRAAFDIPAAFRVVTFAIFRASLADACSAFRPFFAITLPCLAAFRFAWDAVFEACAFTRRTLREMAMITLFDKCQVRESAR